MVGQLRLERAALTVDATELTNTPFEIPAELPDQRRIFEYWSSKRRGSELPSRSDIDPVDLPPKLLPDISLVTVSHQEDGERVFRFRLVGTNVVRNCGIDVTGRVFEDIFRDARDLSVERSYYNQVVETREASYFQAPVNFPGRDFLSSSRILLPLAADGRAVDMILSLS